MEFATLSRRVSFIANRLQTGNVFARLCHPSTRSLREADKKLCQNLLQQLLKMLQDILKLETPFEARNSLERLCTILTRKNQSPTMAQPNFFYIGNGRYRPNEHRYGFQRMIPFQNIVIQRTFQDSTLEEPSFRTKITEYFATQQRILEMGLRFVPFKAEFHNQHFYRPFEEMYHSVSAVRPKAALCFSFQYSCSIHLLSFFSIL